MIAVLVSLVLAGCGGSSSSSSSSAGSSSPSASASTTSAASSSAPPPASSSTTSATATSTPSAAASTTATSSSTGAPGPDTHVRLAATFMIRSGGVLAPPAVAAPKHTTIVLTVRAVDGKSHTLVVATAHAHTLDVAAGQPARLVLKGLPNGSYPVKVDGAVHGRLIVGVAPGP